MRIPLLVRHQSIGNHDKHVSRSSNWETQAAFLVHYLNSDNAQKRLPNEKYELQNEGELSVAMVRRNLGSTTRTKRDYLLPTLPTTELNNLPIFLYCIMCELSQITVLVN